MAKKSFKIREIFKPQKKMDNFTHSYTTKTDRKEPVPCDYRELLQISKKNIQQKMSKDTN